MKLDETTVIGFPTEDGWADLYQRLRKALVHGLSANYCLADREDALGLGLYRHHRRLAQHDAAVLRVDQRVGGSEIDADVGREQRLYFAEHSGAILPFFAPRGQYPPEDFRGCRDAALGWWAIVDSDH